MRPLSSLQQPMPSGSQPKTYQQLLSPLLSHVSLKPTPNEAAKTERGRHSSRPEAQATCYFPRIWCPLPFNPSKSLEFCSLYSLTIRQMMHPSPKRYHLGRVADWLRCVEAMLAHTIILSPLWDFLTKTNFNIFSSINSLILFYL